LWDKDGTPSHVGLLRTIVNTVLDRPGVSFDDLQRDLMMLSPSELRTLLRFVLCCFGDVNGGFPFTVVSTRVHPSMAAVFCCRQLKMDGLIKDHVGCVPFRGEPVSSSAPSDHFHAERLSAMIGHASITSIEFGCDLTCDGRKLAVMCPRHYFGAPDALVRLCDLYPVPTSAPRVPGGPPKKRARKAAAASSSADEPHVLCSQDV
jgi:hypothetical protein